MNVLPSVSTQSFVVFAAPRTCSCDAVVRSFGRSFVLHLDATASSHATMAIILGGDDVGFLETATDESPRDDAVTAAPFLISRPSSTVNHATRLIQQPPTLSTLTYKRAP